MAEKDGKKVVEFESLELEEEEGKEAPSKMEVLLSFVKERLSEEDYASLQKELGIEGTEMSNEELFEQIKALLEGAEKPGEEEEEEDPDETEMANQQTFMEECLASGKDRDACLEEWKKKAPPESKEEEGEPDFELAGKVEELERQLAELAKAKDLGEVTADVEKLIVAKHIAPVQRAKAIKLASNLKPEERGEFYEFWKTQRFTVSDDVGTLESSRAGAQGVMTPERRAEILRVSGLGDLIKDKADKSKLPWKMENN